MQIPFFLTIDTEGDNIWDRPKYIKSTNVENLYRFQELCNIYHIKPIYLTNYEASINKLFQKFIEEHNNNLEIGLHLHAWNSPPIYNLTENDYFYQPYLHEYPKKIIKSKIDFMVKHLQDIFQTEIISHRGGRYSINDDIFESLIENGIKIDCSVVPGINWSESIGNPNSKGGPDFRKSPRNAYYIYKSLLELPVSTTSVNTALNYLSETNILRRIISKIFNTKNLILRSKVSNLKELQKVIEWNLSQNCTHLEYIIHSSELVQGTSSLIKSKKEEEIFYKNLEQFFMYLNTINIKSMTFKEYIK